MSKWPVVPLSAVASAVDRSVPVLAGTAYRTIGVKLWGEGAYERATIDGSQTAAKTLSIVRRGDLIINKIWVRHGSVAVAGEDVDGCAASGEFPTFAPNLDRVVPRWLHWFCKARAFWIACDGLSRGTSGKNRIRPELFLTLSIPLPPLVEQRRIVARIDGIAAKLASLGQLQTARASSVDRLYQAERDRVFKSVRSRARKIGDLFDLINGRAFKPSEWQSAGRRIIRIQNLKYPEAPFNRFSGQVDGKHLVHSGDVLFAWSGQVVSLGAHVWKGEEAVLNQHIFKVVPKKPMLPGFVREGFNALIDEMKEQVRGLEMFHIRKQEVDELMFPDLTTEKQQSVVDYLGSLRSRSSELAGLHRASCAETAALLPSILDRAFRGEL